VSETEREGGSEGGREVDAGGDCSILSRLVLRACIMACITAVSRACIIFMIPVVMVDKKCWILEVLIGF
jgi:hypothetical protein